MTSDSPDGRVTNVVNLKAVDLGEECGEPGGFLKNLARLNQSVTLVDGEEYSRRTIDFWHEHVYKKNNNTTPFTIDNILAGRLDKHRRIEKNEAGTRDEQDVAFLQLPATIVSPTTIHQTVAPTPVQQSENNNTEPLNLIVNKRKRITNTKGKISIDLFGTFSTFQTGRNGELWRMSRFVSMY